MRAPIARKTLPPKETTMNVTAPHATKTVSAPIALMTFEMREATENDLKASYRLFYHLLIISILSSN